MNFEGQEYLERKIPVTSIRCLSLKERYAEHYNELLEIFQKYDVLIEELQEYTQLTFPSGTYKQPMYPTVTVDRYKIFISDFCLIQTHTPTGDVVIRIPLQFFSDETQERYKNHPSNTKSWLVRRR